MALNRRGLPELSLRGLPAEFIDAMDDLGIAAIDVEIRQPDDTDYADHLAALAAVLDLVASGG